MLKHWAGCLLTTFNKEVETRNQKENIEIVHFDVGWKAKCPLCSVFIPIANKAGRFQSSNFYAHVRCYHKSTDSENADQEEEDELELDSATTSSSSMSHQPQTSKSSNKRPNFERIPSVRVRKLRNTRN